MSLPSPEELGKTSGVLYIALGSFSGPQEVYFSPDSSATGSGALLRNTERWKSVVQAKGLLLEHVHVDHYPVTADELRDMFPVAATDEAAEQVIDLTSRRMDTEPTTRPFSIIHGMRGH
jgi:hypothetical protein